MAVLIRHFFLAHHESRREPAQFSGVHRYEASFRVHRRQLRQVLGSHGRQGRRDGLLWPAGDGGQTQTKSFGDAAAAQKHADKQIEQKLDKGYVECSA
jgi:predicted DNA-binding WGR domain protein